MRGNNLRTVYVALTHRANERRAIWFRKVLQVEGFDCCTSAGHTQLGRPIELSILWILIVVILVLALLGFFGRGRVF